MYHQELYNDETEYRRNLLESWHRTADLQAMRAAKCRPVEGWANVISEDLRAVVYSLPAWPFAYWLTH
jgi:hypothetical protein